MNADALRLTPVLTPQGRLVLEPQNDAPLLEAALAGRLAEAFARGGGHGLVQLGAVEVGSALPPVLAWWRAFGGRSPSCIKRNSFWTDDSAPRFQSFHDPQLFIMAPLATIFINVIQQLPPIFFTTVFTACF